MMADAAKGWVRFSLSCRLEGTVKVTEDYFPLSLMLSLSLSKLHLSVAGKVTKSASNSF